MIIFKEIRWSNAFSYGPNNVIRLDTTPLTQIVGKNGHGKSSIALILEEVLYNQNSKKIKKADILNRYTPDKNYSIELDFNKDGAEYTVKTSRTNTSTTVKLFGSSGSFMYMLLRAAFFVLFFVFFVLVIVYVRGLIQTKCECSEDVRREVMYIYAILEVVMLSLSVVFVLLESIVQGAFAIGMNTVKEMSNDSRELNSTVSNPLKSLTKVPKNLGKLSKSLNKTLSKSKSKK
jgi:energy-coupling factor transporter ATP-binding protein EcfA2